MPDKKPQQFKLNYFDIIKGVLFPNRGLSSSQKAAIAAKTSATPPAPKPAAAATSPASTPAAAAAPVDKQPEAAAKPAQKVFQAGKLLPAFWTVASVLSFIVNAILIVVLVIVAGQLFTLKKIVNENLLGGLYENFILMDQAHIKTDITVQDTIPIKFDLPISQDTVVVLNQDTPINNVLVQINTGSLSINSYARIVLPAQTNLPIHLQITVPVEAQVPVTIKVPVDIPLEKTELHKPFVGLQGVVSPFYWMLQPDIKNASDLPACQGVLGGLCRGFFK
jgi:hypothetical protein